MIEEISYQALSKFQVLQEPLQNPPHKCCGCGRYTSGDPKEPLTFIDMGFDIEFLGQAYICVQGCFKEAMNQLGVLTREQCLKLEAKLEKAEAANRLLAEENREYKDAVGSINRAIGAGVRRSLVVSGAESFARAENEPIVSPRASQKSSRGKERLTQQTDERGSTDLSNNEGDELLGDI